MPTAVQRRLPVGAEPVTDGTHFRVWAPRRNQIEVILDRFRTLALERERDGYFSGYAEGVQPGMLYQFRFDRNGPHARRGPTRPSRKHGPLFAPSFRQTRRPFRQQPLQR